MPTIDRRWAVPALLRLAVGLLAAPVAVAQPAGEPWRGLTCTDGGDTIAFRFDGRGGATLSRLEGRRVAAFPDLNVPDWTVRLVAGPGGPRIHVANARGALLTVGSSERPVGRMTWNHPPGARADLLCDVAH